MRLPIGTVIVALAAASCAPGDEATPTAGRGPALVEVEGPVVGLTIAAAIDERGNVVDPGRIFAASAPQIAAVAFAGPSPGEAVFEWYALAPGAGEEPQRTKLFEHRVAAGPLARAFSVGTSPGRLTSGTYEVVASLGGASRTAEFEVAGAQGAAAAAAPAGQEGAPQSGESGTRAGAAAGPPYPSQPLAMLSLGLEGPPLEVNFFTMWASADGTLGGEPARRGFTAEASIAAGGAPRTDRIAHPAGEEAVRHAGALDPCRLEGGSDLPGTRLTVALRFVEGGPGEVDGPADPALGPDQTRPAISTFDTSRPDRARVQEGEVIGFDVIARDQNRPGATWQTGVRRLEVVANGQRVAGAVVEGPPLAPSCDDSARVLNLQGEYRVPRNPPPVIRLCARAQDYVPNPTTERCVTYATANVWKGTAPSMRSEAVYANGAARCADAWRLDFTFVEAQDGTISGDGTADLVADWVCQPTFPGASSPSHHFTYTVEGERRGDAFILRFASTTGTAGIGWAALTQGLGEPVEVEIPTLGDRSSANARWTYSHVDPTGTRQNYKVEGKITIECQQCAPGVG